MVVVDYQNRQLLCRDYCFRTSSRPWVDSLLDQRLSVCYGLDKGLVRVGAREHPSKSGGGTIGGNQRDIEHLFLMTVLLCRASSLAPVTVHTVLLERSVYIDW